ncbi:MAG: methyltransferase [Ferrovibrio sp.]|uniref:methyltransferase n=1 Tax=Ferrovibrio sp. TaxID=1917215 RepID=UPI003918B8E6
MIPDNYKHLFSKAWAYQNSSQFGEAVKVYLNIIENMNSAVAWIGLGQCYLEMNKGSEALGAFRRAYELLPQSGAIKHMIDMLEGGEPPSRAPIDYILWVFNQHADSFDEHLLALDYKGPEMIASLIPDSWAANSRYTLDLGCGTGLNSIYFSKYSTKLDGVDISPRMLAQAAKRNYDCLYQAEIHEFLKKSKNKYDTILASDVFIYIGYLDELFALFTSSLSKDGNIFFTIELNTEIDRPVDLMTTGRYRHSINYIEECADKSGFKIAAFTDGSIRTENGVPQAARAYRLRKSARI